MSSEDGDGRICDIAASVVARNACTPRADDASMAHAVRNIMDFIKAQLFVVNSWTERGTTYWKIDLSSVLNAALAKHGTRLFDVLRGEMIQTEAGVRRGYITCIDTTFDTGTITVCTWRRT